MKKMIKFGEDLVIQGFIIHLKTLNTNPYVLTVHGRFDNIMVWIVFLYYYFLNIVVSDVQWKLIPFFQSKLIY